MPLQCLKVKHQRSQQLNFSSRPSRWSGCYLIKPFFKTHAPLLRSNRRLCSQISQIMKTWSWARCKGLTVRHTVPCCGNAGWTRDRNLEDMRVQYVDWCRKSKINGSPIDCGLRRFWNLRAGNTLQYRKRWWRGLQHECWCIGVLVWAMHMLPTQTPKRIGTNLGFWLCTFSVMHVVFANAFFDQLSLARRIAGVFMGLAKICSIFEQNSWLVLTFDVVGTTSLFINYCVFWNLKLIDIRIYFYICLGLALMQTLLTLSFYNTSWKMLTCFTENVFRATRCALTLFPNSILCSW